MDEINLPAVGGGMHRALLGACRYAAKQGSRGISTKDVLLSMMLRVPDLGAMLDYPPAASSARYPPVAASPPPGGDADPDVADLAVAELREAHWRVFGLSAHTAPQWDSEAYSAARRALAGAAAAGRAWAGMDHLLAALLADPGNRASGFLRAQRIDLYLLDQAARLAWPFGDRERPSYPLSGFLEQCGILADPDRPARPKAKHRWASRLTALVAQASPALTGLEQEAMAETVRLGHPVVGLRHLLLAILRLEEEMRTTGLRPTPAHAAANSIVLLDFHLTHRSAARLAATVFPSVEIAPPRRRRGWRSDPKNPRWTVPAERAAERARIPSAGSAHLLHAILTDPDGEARAMLTALSADPGAILKRLATVIDRPFA